MSDALKFIQQDTAFGNDPHGHLLGLEDWSESRAAELAAGQGLELSREHLSVLRFLRDHYRQHGPTDSARRLSLAMESAFATQGGLRYLYRLFPNGPVNTGSRLAGLPVPGNSSDPAFGVVH